MYTLYFKLIDSWIHTFHATSTDPEWNSDDDDNHDDHHQHDKKDTKDKKNKQQQKKIVKELLKGGSENNSKNNDNSNNKSIKDSTVIYIGHLPVHMQELELVAFLKQFGAIVNLRLSRSPKTGRPRGYAFCQFTSSDIAHIVAETLSGYIVAGTKRLVCHVVPTCHRHLFDTKGSNFVPTQQRTSPRRKSLDKLKQITTRLLQREGKKRMALAAKGIEYDFPGYAGKEKEKDESSSSSNNNSNKKLSLDGKKKRKESMDSVQSTESQQQHKKRKDSMASAESTTEGVTSKTKKRKESIESSSVEVVGNKKKKDAPMSEQKQKKTTNPTKKDKKRRAST